MARQYGAFWGCFVTGRFPFIEKATRVAFDNFGLPLADIQDITCCPEKSLVGSDEHELWLLTAARNLAVAEEQGLAIVTPCNGCYGTLKGANEELRADPGLRARTNERLSKVNRQWRGTAEVFHLVEVLHDHLGVGEITRRVVRPLEDIRLAVHAGCHYARPSNALRADNPMDPRRFDALVKAIGATSVPYDTKLLCCGGTLNTAGSAEQAADITREKLVELRRLEVDALTTCCPACFMQYDVAQLVMARQGDVYDIPCVTIPELLCVAVGVDYRELGPDLHRIDPVPFYEKCLAVGKVGVA